jgi:hypothetical protein
MDYTATSIARFNSFFFAFVVTMEQTGQNYCLKWNLRAPTRALGIEHTLFEANFGFSPEESLDLVFTMRPSIPVSQDATERLKL